jgi:RNA polymerase sigma factor (sigma-70 family)
MYLAVSFNANNTGWPYSVLKGETGGMKIYIFSTQPFALNLHLAIKRATFLDQSELNLVRGCVAGNRNCQSELYGRYAPKMMGISLRYAKRREEAEDILQESFIKVFKSIAQFKYNGSLEGWIRKITINTALEYYRSKMHLNPVVDIDTVQVENFSTQDIFGNINVKDLVKMVQALPTAYRMVFNLYVFEGYKHKEIAVMLRISEGTSKSNLYDARALLQRGIQQSKSVAN